MPSFSRQLEESLHRAVAYANQRKHEYATLEHLLLSLVDDDRRGAVVNLENETWTTHLVLLGSNATFTVPSRPAECAWSSASRHRCRG